MFPPALPGPAPLDCPQFHETDLCTRPAAIWEATHQAFRFGLVAVVSNGTLAPEGGPLLYLMTPEKLRTLCGPSR